VATIYTANALLQKPATADRYWDVPLNANSDFLDGVSAIGRLLVTPTEVPSATLNVRVTPGTYVTANGTIGTFAGVASQALPASTTTYLWLTDAGVLSASASFPTAAHVRLASVATGPSSVLSVVDGRVGPQTSGTGLGFVLKAGDTMTGALSVVSPSSGTAALTVNPSAQTLGFFGATPATQAPAVAPLVDNSNGVTSNTVVDVGATFSQAQIDANFATLAAKVNALIAALKRHGLMSS
jgi:hypothetical protein